MLASPRFVIVGPKTPPSTEHWYLVPLALDQDLVSLVLEPDQLGEEEALLDGLLWLESIFCWTILQGRLLA